MNVANKEPKNEQAVCYVVAKFLADRQGDVVTKIESIDAVVRDRQAVEAIYHTRSSRFALEHTRIESFRDQIGLGKQFAQLLGSLETDLAGKLPGAFFLTVPVGTARAPAADQDNVRAALSVWILANAATLEAGERVGPRGRCAITATPRGVPFEVTLHRDSDHDSRLFIWQGLNGDRQQGRRAAVARSLQNKCPKLKAAKDNGCVSVLILESDDSLANHVVVAEAVEAELMKRNDQPDIVVWARTRTRPWKAALIKDGAAIYPDVDATLFAFGSLS